MGRALYRKYRSKKLSEIVGQEHVTTALSNALKNGRVGHAYLFTGPRGTGKTSIARIMAHEVNGIPYDEDATHLDIIEIDAASNRRIDEIRSLREKVHNTPTSAKYKVYIIDEVHMLTKEAFNALLKTLEEPPAHVIFILATTEAHKLPDTIISRTQRYTFKPAERDIAAKHLRTIANSEGLDISDDALDLVAVHGRGSFRDSISLLDQIGNTSGRIELDDVRRSLGIAPDEAILELVETVATGTPGQILTQVKALVGQGYQAPQIAKQLSRILRKGLVDGDGQLDHRVASQLMQRLIDVPAAHDPTALLEIILLDPILARTQKIPEPKAASPAVTKATAEPESKPEPAKPSKKPEPQPEAKLATKDQPQEPATKEPEPEDTQPETKSPESAQPAETPAPASTSSEPVLLDESAWQRVLHKLKQKHNTLYGVARMAVPVFESDKLTLNFGFPFHQKRMNDAKNKSIISAIVAQDLGRTIEINCVVDKNPGSASAGQPAAEKSPAKAKDHIDTISNIFGDAEVLE